MGSGFGVDYCNVRVVAVDCEMMWDELWSFCVDYSIGALFGWYFKSCVDL
jgi:hypothetical protein